jgi:GNAT superfamily N-acetyltransferase
LQPSPAAAERLPRLARAREVWRVEGLHSLCMAALAATVYRRLVIFERDFEAAPVPIPDGLEMRWIGPDLLDEYAAVRGERDVAEERLASGLRCSGTWLHGELVVVRWLAAGEVWIDYLDLRLPLADDEIFILDTFTAPGRRGGGIAPAGFAVLLAELAAEGRSRALGGVLPENRAAVRNVEKSGFEPTGRMGCVRLGPWRRGFVRRRRP